MKTKEMKLNILIGGKAGQGINKISEIVSNLLLKQGYFVFNYRDYQSLIRGGHNFNIVSFSDKKISSCDSKVDVLVSLDENTKKIHKLELKKDSLIVSSDSYSDIGRDTNIALAADLAKILGISENDFAGEIKKEFEDKEDLARKFFQDSKQTKKFNLEKINRDLISMDGSHAVAKGAFDSGLDFFISYPMTPATGVLHAMAEYQEKNKNINIFQPESEVGAINYALGSSFSGKSTMVATAGGGFDLMTEGLSFAGQSEIPITFYVASRPGPSTGVPTYTSQDDLNLVLHAGHGEFPRIVLAPGDVKQSIERTNELLLLAENYNVPCLLLSDKHLAESMFSTDEKIKPLKKIKISRKIPGGKDLIKATSYEHLTNGDTTEDGAQIKLSVERRLKKQKEINKEIEKLSPIEIYGRKNSKNLILTFGSTKNVVQDVIENENLDVKVLQIIYLEPFSRKIEKEIKKARKVFVVEQNATSQLSRLIREKTGFEVPEKNRILKYDGRPFFYDELRGMLGRIGK